jgi:two-component system, OmpR family, osmolarity sensor histidine kinase EnvZ
MLLRPKALTRAISNLVDNAWKYGASAVSIGASVEPAQLIISIEDNGPGIPDGKWSA